MTVPAGVLFDKDGTLFDFRATWDVWAGRVLRQLARGDTGRLTAMALSARYDLDRAAFAPDSAVIAGTNREVADLLHPHLPDWTVPDLERHLATEATRAPLAEAAPLGPLLARLRAAGLRLGVMTNDTESTARVHLATAGIDRAFDFVAGFDSGFGAKPDPAPLLAFARHTGLAPAQVVMVGDSTHDLVAGRAAGMATVGVLTGTAGAAELAPLADVILPDIGHLPGWLAGQGIATLA